MDGILLINKKKGEISHDVIRKIRGVFRKTKVGHLGTLDPMATGLLPVMIGRANRLHIYLSASKKKYRAAVFLGQNMDTYDAEGTPTSELVEAKFAGSAIEKVSSRFVGQIEQMPPLYSAIKLKGKPLYKYARNGETPEVKARKVEIFSINIISIDSNIFEMDIFCSSGTYIRSLAYDIGEALGCGAHLKRLERTHVGEFRVHDSISLDDFIKDDLSLEGKHYFRSIQTLLPHLPTIHLRDEQALLCFTNGKVLTDENYYPAVDPEQERVDSYSSVDGNIARVFYNDHFLGIAEIEGKDLKPKTVFPVK
jgi:tRNA pseudouridine55 synthase